MSSPSTSVTQLIIAHRNGDQQAFDRLVSVLYDDLRRLAHGQLRRLKSWEGLNTTALVHEAYVKLVAKEDRGWESEGHFLATSAKAMRHILVDAARRRLAAKHGGGQIPETLDDRLCGENSHAAEVLSVHEALDQLREIDQRMCQVVECRFFAGYSVEEAAKALGISQRTLHRDWLRARAWLRRWLAAADGGEPREVEEEA